MPWYVAVGILIALGLAMLKIYEPKLNAMFCISVSIGEPHFAGDGFRWWHVIVSTRQRWWLIDEAPLPGCEVWLEYLTPEGHLVARTLGNWTTNRGMQHSLELDVSQRHPVPIVLRSLVPTILFARVEPGPVYVTDEHFFTQRAESIRLVLPKYLVRVSVRLRKMILAQASFVLTIPDQGLDEFVLAEWEQPHGV